MGAHSQAPRAVLPLGGFLLLQWYSDVLPSRSLLARQVHSALAFMFPSELVAHFWAG